MQKLARHFKTITKFSELFIEQNRNKILKNLVDLDGMGRNSKNLYFFLKFKNIDIIKNLIAVLKIKKF